MVGESITIGRRYLLFGGYETDRAILQSLLRGGDCQRLSEAGEIPVLTSAAGSSDTFRPPQKL